MTEEQLVKGLSLKNKMEVHERRISQLEKALASCKEDGAIKITVGTYRHEASFDLRFKGSENPEADALGMVQLINNEILISKCTISDAKEEMKNI